MESAPFFDDLASGPEGQTYWLRCDDDVRIRIGVWPMVGAKGTVLLFPGRTEYIEKYGRAAGELAKRGYATLAIDWRGQGLADRLIDDRRLGHVLEFTDYQHDVAAALKAAEDLNLPRPFHLIGHSMGGCIGLRAVMEGLPVASCVFSAPMWGILMSASQRPFAWTLGWSSKRFGFGNRRAPGTKDMAYVQTDPFENNTLTTDQVMFEMMRDHLTAQPDLGLGGPTLHWLHEALQEMRRLAARPSPNLPCLTFLGTHERIVDPARIHDRMARWPNGTLDVLEGAEHEVMMESLEIRTHVFDAMGAFFDKADAHPTAASA